MRFLTGERPRRPHSGLSRQSEPQGQLPSVESQCGQDHANPKPHVTWVTCNLKRQCQATDHNDKHPYHPEGIQVIGTEFRAK